MTVSHRVVTVGIACVAALAACAVQAGSLDRALRDAEGKGEFPKLTSVLVLEDGKTTYEGYFGGTDAETLQDTRSATKSVTSLAAGIAVAEGKIRSVSSPAFAFLADLKPFAHDGETKSAITVEDLLTMSSALDCDDNDRSEPGSMCCPISPAFRIDLVAHGSSGRGIVTAMIGDRLVRGAHARGLHQQRSG